MQVSHRDVNTFWILQNNNSVIGVVNELTKCRKGNYISTFNFPPLYTKLPHNKLLMVLNNLTDFCFDGGESNFINVRNYGTR